MAHRQETMRDFCPKARRTRLAIQLLQRPRILLTLASFCGVSIGPQATAQEVPVPPVNEFVDEHGADMMSNRTILRGRTIKLGDSDLSLSFRRDWLMNEWRDSFHGDMSWAAGRMSVSIGSHSAEFDVPGAPAASTYSRHGDGHILEFNASTQRFTFKGRDGTIAYFLRTTNANTPITAKFGRLERVIRPNGEVLELTYNASTTNPRLESVDSSLGYQIKYYYVENHLDPDFLSSWHAIKEVRLINKFLQYCEPRTLSACPSHGILQFEGILRIPPNEGNDQGPQFEIAEDASTRRFFVDDTRRIRIIYEASHLTGSPYLQPPPPIVTTMDYPAWPSVINRQITKDGGTWSYKFERATVGTEFIDTYTRVDPANKEFKVVVIPAKNVIKSITDELGRTTSRDHDQFGRVTRETRPEGDVSEFAYDFRGNVLEVRLKAKPGNGVADIVHTATYPTSCPALVTCNKPLSITTPRGHTTDFTYDPVHGGVLTETGPAGTNGIRPVKRFAYAQRYAWVKNASGGHVAAASPIWLLIEERTCRETATVGNGCAGGPADEVVTAYDYGSAMVPGNLWLRGKTVSADGQTLRTCYGHDVRGNRISETEPRASLTSCP